jgi:hypothetical protein
MVVFEALVLVAAWLVARATASVGWGVVTFFGAFIVGFPILMLPMQRLRTRSVIRAQSRADDESAQRSV